MTSPFRPASPAAPTWYDIVDSPVGRILLSGDEQALSGLHLLDAGERSASVQPGWTRRVPAGRRAAGGVLRGRAAGVRAAARAARNALPARGLGRAHQDPVRHDGQLRCGRGRTRQVAGRLPRRRPGQRAQPDLDHRALPPGDRRGRHAHRIRLGRRAQGLAAAPRGSSRRHRPVRLPAQPLRLAGGSPARRGATPAGAGRPGPAAGCRSRPGRTRRP